MPKIIELTVELEIQSVSCPGVWLCQDGRVSLAVFALGTSYQTCLLPPTFPLLFKDVFYFRKRFQETCALNNICCLLKDETIFCELMQWSEDCNSRECTILAQYLGALNDVLFPPNMCSNEGVDLLMRRSKDFPGILSPKIEIATKVRIDEVWNTGNHYSQVKTTSCHCGAEADQVRQRQVCHTPQYHRIKCGNTGGGGGLGRRPQSRSRSRSAGSRSCASLKEPEIPYGSCKCPNPVPSRSPRSPCRPRSACRPRHYASYNVYSVSTERLRTKQKDGRGYDSAVDEDETPSPRSRSSSRHSAVYNAEAEPPEWTRDRITRVQDFDEHLNPSPRSRSRERRPRSSSRQFRVYNVEAEPPEWTRDRITRAEDFDEHLRLKPTENYYSSPDYKQDKHQKIQLESRYIEDAEERSSPKDIFLVKTKPKLKPCVCEICRRYHELFHSEYTKS